MLLFNNHYPIVIDLKYHLVSLTAWILFSLYVRREGRAVLVPDNSPPQLYFHYTYDTYTMYRQEGNCLGLKKREGNCPGGGDTYV